MCNNTSVIFKSNMKEDVADFTSALSQSAKKLLNIGPEDFKCVMKHYDVTPEVVEGMVRSVRDWLKKQPHLPENKLRDKQIIGNLIFRGFSVENVKHTIDNYFSARHRMPDILCGRDPLEPTLSGYIKQGYWIAIPQKTPENHRVTIFRMTPNENIFVPTLAKIPFMFFEYRIWNDVSLGDRWIMDLENVSLYMTLQMTPLMIYNIVYYIMACFGTRLKSIHIINMPPFAAAIVSMVKKLMKSKLADRVFVATREDVMKAFPKNCLPTELDGEAGSYQEIADEWCKTVQSDAWRQFFIEQDNVFSDESKRLKPSSANELFGADGTFRKLSID